MGAYIDGMLVCGVTISKKFIIIIVFVILARVKRGQARSFSSNTESSDSISNILLDRLI